MQNRFNNSVIKAKSWLKPLEEYIQFPPRNGRHQNIMIKMTGEGLGSTMAESYLTKQFIIDLLPYLVGSKISFWNLKEYKIKNEAERLCRLY